MNKPSGKADLRVLFVSQWFDPEPVPKGLAFVKALAEQGIKVDVLTGFPNYPGGRVYPGFRIRPVVRELVDGVKITRLALYPSHDRNVLGRALNYLSFCFSVFWYLLVAARGKYDVTHVYHPPITVGFAAVMAQMVWRRPVVLEVQDLWPDSLKATGMANLSPLVKGVGWMCRFVYARASHIIAQSQGMAQALAARGVPTEKLAIVHNWADLPAGKSSQQHRPEGWPEADFTVLFAGNLGLAQSLETVVAAAALVGAARPGISFIFLGSGIAEGGLRAEARRVEADNVFFLPRVPMAEVDAYLQRADALLVHLADDPLFELTVPSKTQAYMAAGRPVIMGVRGDAAELVERAGCGLVVPPQDPAALAEAVIALAEMPEEARSRMGERGRMFYDSHLSVAHGVSKIAEVLRAAANAA
ncbi:MAG: glycosyltransferase family 4 protein [Devosia sp.]